MLDFFLLNCQHFQTFILYDCLCSDSRYIFYLLKRHDEKCCLIMFRSCEIHVVAISDIGITGIMTDYRSDVHACCFRLKASGVAVRFCSNTSNHTKTEFANLLLSLGFDVSVQQIFTPAPVVAKFLKEKNLRPFLLVADGMCLN